LKAPSILSKNTAENRNILRSLKEQADTHAEKFSTIFNQMDNIKVSLRKNEEKISTCVVEVTKLKKKLDEVEDRSRRNNVRQVGLPTGAEGDKPRGYLQRMLPIWIPQIGGSHPLETEPIGST